MNNKNNECSHDCSSCGKASSCKDNQSQKLEPNKKSSIKHIVGVVSGKGGVGKSLVSGLLATKLNKQGMKVGILDADITGPSIPKMFGIDSRIEAEDSAMFPKVSNSGIKLISTNLLLDDPSAPVAWRGPVITGVIFQFFNQVNWGDLDVLIIDMPPGTSDVFLSIMQKIPIDGIVSVSTPQDLVGMIVGKAINLAGMMNIPTLSAVENMSYFKCDECDKNHEIFGKSQVKDIAKKYIINSVDTLPMDPNVASKCDAGQVEEIDVINLLENTSNAIKNL